MHLLINYIKFKLSAVSVERSKIQKLILKTNEKNFLKIASIYYQKKKYSEIIARTKEVRPSCNLHTSPEIEKLSYGQTEKE